MDVEKKQEGIFYEFLSRINERSGMPTYKNSSQAENFPV